jgi:membrane-associated phospholipid phosphatase
MRLAMDLFHMRALHVEPLSTDRAIARFVADHTTPKLEWVSRALSWAADEHVLYAVSIGLWLSSLRGGPRQRACADHLVACVLTSSILPHLLKDFVDQERPDRCMVHGRRHGIPRSGKPLDSFPSGHAMHVGALASAISRMHPDWKKLAWTIGGVLAATRIIVLAHWASDVVVGLGAGVLIERLLRPVARHRLRRDLRPTRYQSMRAGHRRPMDHSPRTQR